MTERTDDSIELEAPSVQYHSHYDEAAFFEWIEKLKCVTGVEGRGRSVFVLVDRKKLDEGELRELISLFRRYKIPMRQLRVFDQDSFAEWFRDAKSYWFREIFGES